MTTQIKLDVRTMAEDTAFIIAAFFESLPGLTSWLPTRRIGAAINRALKATRYCVTSHLLPSMRRLFNVGNFNSTKLNQSDVDTMLSTSFWYFVDISNHYSNIQTPNENRNGMRQAMSGQQHLELQLRQPVRGHFCRFNDTGIHVPVQGHLTVSHRLNTATHHC